MEKYTTNAPSRWIYKIINDFKTDKLSSKGFNNVFKKWKKNRDEALMEKLIRSQLINLIKPALYYSRSCFRSDYFFDLISVGKIAIIDSLNSFDVKYGSHFCSYVQIGIQRRMLTAINNLIYGFVNLSAPIAADTNIIKPKEVFLDQKIGEKKNTEIRDVLDLSLVENMENMENKDLERFYATDEYEALIKNLDPDEKYLVNWHFKHEKTIISWGRKFGIKRCRADTEKIRILRKLKGFAYELGLAEGFKEEIITEKNCVNPNCVQKNPQPVSNFTSYTGSKDGLAYRCKKCING